MVSLRLIMQIIQKVASDHSGHFQALKLSLMNTQLPQLRAFRIQ